jgi:hypothetical protein
VIEGQTKERLGKMKNYLIYNKLGADLGVYQGESGEDAIKAMVADGGGSVDSIDPNISFKDADRALHFIDHMRKGDFDDKQIIDFLQDGEALSSCGFSDDDIKDIEIAQQILKNQNC